MIFTILKIVGGVIAFLIGLILFTVAYMAHGEVIEQQELRRRIAKNDRKRKENR